MIKRIRSVDYKNPIILFLLSPFGAMLLSFKYAHQKWAKNIFWLFCIFFGYTMVIAPNSEADGARYRDWFIALSKEDISSSNFTELLYSGGESGDNTYLDIVQPLVSFLLSRVTDNYHYLFAVFALIYGYFNSRNIWYLLERIKLKQSLTISLFILTFILICPIWRINAFRFWTATQIFLFGVIPYLVERKKKNLFVASLSVLAHFTFILPVVILFLYTFIGNKTKLLFIFFIVTSVIQESNLSTFKNASMSLPEVFQGKVKAYVIETEPENTSGIGSNIVKLNWFIKYNVLFQKIIVYLFIITIYFKGNLVIEKSRDLQNLFCFSMLFYGFCNIVNELPQGVRFYTVGNLLVFFLIIFYATHSNGIGAKMINKLSIVLVPILLVLIAVSLRISLEVAGIVTIVGNPFMAPFIEYDLPLIDLIKN